MEEASLQVEGSYENALDVTLTAANILYSGPQYPSTHYYYKGTTELTIGARKVTVPVSVVLNIEDKDLNHLNGVIELPDQYVKTSLEAYKTN